MFVGIVGSREYGNKYAVKVFIKNLHRKYKFDIVIVSGGARGVDTWAEEEATLLNLKILRIPPQCPKDVSRGEYIKALFERNTEIVDWSDNLVVFHNGISQGTLDGVGKALNLGKGVFIYDENGKLFTGNEAYDYWESHVR